MPESQWLKRSNLNESSRDRVDKLNIVFPDLKVSNSLQ